MQDNPYAYWESALAGENPKMFVDDPQNGFYRRKTSKGPNAKYQPVAIWNEGQNARVGDTDIAGDAVRELWNWIAANPISEETYRAVAERGEPWPDAHDPSKNMPTTHPVPDGAMGTSPENVLAMHIAEAKAGISQYAKIESDEQSAQARSLQSELLGLKGEVIKLHKAEKEPHLDAGRAVDRKWFPLRDDADAGAIQLRSAMEDWEDWKREQARKTQAEADRIAREHAEAVRKAEAANAPPPAPPPIVKPNAPAPAAQIKGASGKAARVKVKQVVVSIDEDKAFAMFKGNAELSALLMALAQKAIDAGMPVPGAITEERSTIR